MSRPSVRWGRAFQGDVLRLEHLPFRVRLASDRSDWLKALPLRQIAYSRHIPEMGQQLAQLEADDLRADALLLLAEHKDDGRILGSMRLLTNTFAPLGVERHVQLPARLKNRHLIEARRLTVCSGPDQRMVTPALMKAMSLVCYLCGMDEVLITARPPVDRLYRSMQFQDALDGRKLVLPDVAAVEHTLYFLEIMTAEARWRESGWPFYPFMVEVEHPDIVLDPVIALRCIDNAPLLAPAAMPAKSLSAGRWAYSEEIV